MLKGIVYLALLIPCLNYAETYVRIGPDGRKTITNIPPKGESEPTTTAPQKLPPVLPPLIQKHAPKTPHGFPTISAAQQQDRDKTRQEILQKELALEKQELAAALLRKDPKAINRHKDNVSAIGREIAGIH